MLNLYLLVRRILAGDRPPISSLEGREFDTINQLQRTANPDGMECGDVHFISS
jgi:hypothetical protein